MASLTSKGVSPLENYLPEPTFYLNAVTPRPRYEDGKRLDEILGYVYTVTNTATYDQIRVFIPGLKPLIEPDALMELQEAGERRFVEFHKAVLRPYYNERSHSIEDSIRAESVQFVTVDGSEVLYP